MELGLTLDTVQMLERWFRRQVRDWQLAEDLAQETVLRAHQKRDMFDGREPKAWLFRIARNLLIDWSRRVKNDPMRKAAEFDVRDASKMDQELIEARDEAERIERAMFTADLTDEQRVTFRLFQTGRRLSEIAAEFQIPLPTVKSRLRIAREKIRVAVGA